MLKRELYREVWIMRCHPPNIITEITWHLSSYFFLILHLCNSDNILDKKVEIKRKGFLSYDNYNFLNEISNIKGKPDATKYFSSKNLSNNFTLRHFCYVFLKKNYMIFDKNDRVSRHCPQKAWFHEKHT